MPLSLDEQARSLLQQPPPAGLPPQAVALAVNLLIEIAGQLGHLHYFVLRDRAGGWGLCDRDAIGVNSLPDFDPLPNGRWLVAHSQREAAMTLQRRINASEQHLQTQAEALETIDMEVLRILWLGLALRRAEGLLFFDREPISAGSHQTADRAIALRTKDLRQQLVSALRRQPPPMA